MKRFDSYEDLIKYIGVDSPENIVRLKDILNRFLEIYGSNLVEHENEEPSICFNVKVDNVMHEIGITSIKNKENEYRYYYWLAENEDERLKYKHKRDDIAKTNAILKYTSKRDERMEKIGAIGMLLMLILGIFVLIMVMAI